MNFLWVILLLASVAARCDEIPSNAERYRRELTKVAHREFGLNAEISRLAAQIQQESQWKEDAESPVGAFGLTQFMPTTAQWIHSKYPGLQVYPVFSAKWAISAQAIYMKELLGQVRFADTACDRWALALRGYNGGIGYIHVEQRKVNYSGKAEEVATKCYRSAASCKENTEYPVRVMRRWEPLYIRARWGGALCQL